MTKQEFVDAVADRAGLTKRDAGAAVDAVLDVVTSGGALLEAVAALREAGLVVRHAVCVVDREEGGADALARAGVRLTALYRASELLAAGGRVDEPHG